MNRVNWLSWGFTSLALGVFFLFAPQVRNAQKGDGIGAQKWQLGEPVRYENLSVFPVVSRQSADTQGFTTLDQGLSSGQVAITEGGTDMIRRSRDGRPAGIPEQRGASVNQLVLINRGPKPLLLLAGEVVSGGKQDRTISKDRIVPPGGAPLPLDVFCVEAGRWTGGAEFSAAKLMVHPSVREQAAIAQQQDKVWQAVRNGTSMHSMPAAPPAPPGGGIGQTSQTVELAPRALAREIELEAPTQSYERIYKSSKIGVPIGTFTEEVQKRFDRATAKMKGEVVGVVVAYGGEVAWSDIFASSSLFDRYWPKLLRSYVVEALTRPKSSEAASIEDAREFLKPLAGHQTIETEPAVYSLKLVTDGRYVEVELEALRPVDVSLHLLKVRRTS